MSERRRTFGSNHAVVSLLSIVGGLLDLGKEISRFGRRQFAVSSPRRRRPSMRVWHLAVIGDLVERIRISGIEFVLAAMSSGLRARHRNRPVDGRKTSAPTCLQPWISRICPTPTIALAPLFLLWLGIGIWSERWIVVVTLSDLHRHHQHRGRLAHDQPAPHRDAAKLRRPAHDLLEGVAAVGDTVV